MVRTLRVGIIIQARLGSVRLPKKVIYNINGKSLIEILIARLSGVKNADEIIVAIPDDQNNSILENHLNSLNLNFSIFKGSESDVLSRYYKAALKFNLDTVVRITADCPLMDPLIVDLLIEKYKLCKPDFLSNRMNYAYPDGMDVEVFSLPVLKKSFDNAQDPLDREHVTRYIIQSNKFSCMDFTDKKINLDKKISVDNQYDLEDVKEIFNYFYPNIFFSLKDIINFIEKA